MKKCVKIYAGALNNFFFPLLKPKGQKKAGNRKNTSLSLSNIYLMFTTNE